MEGKQLVFLPFWSIFCKRAGGGNVEQGLKPVFVILILFFDICFYAFRHAYGRSPNSLPLLFCSLILRGTLLYVFICFMGFSDQRQSTFNHKFSGRLNPKVISSHKHFGKCSYLWSGWKIKWVWFSPQYNICPWNIWSVCLCFNAVPLERLGQIILSVFYVFCFGLFRGSFKMALHKKHRVIIALGNNKDVYSISFFFFWKKYDLL